MLRTTDPLGGTWRHGAAVYLRQQRRALEIAHKEVLLLGTAVVSVASVARVCASIYTLKMGKRNIAEAATSGAGALAPLRGYVRRI